ncbi:MAG: glycosyltransferase family 4 protein [Elusimicrobiota bacterium]
MDILFITHTFPFPVNEGIKMSAYNLIRELSKKHTIVLASLIESSEEEKYVPELKKYCSRIITVIHTIPKLAIRRLKNLIFEKEPFSVLQFYSRELTEKISEVISGTKFDIAHLHFVNTSIYVRALKGLSVVYYPHDAMSLHFLRNAGKEKNLLKKFYLISQYKKMKRWENYVSSKTRKTAVVSAVDRDWLGKNSDIEVIPVGIDPEYFKPISYDEDYPSVIFRGVMNFFPNVDAVLYFYREIYPLVLKEFPELKFYIVGKNPSKEITSLSADKNCIVTGEVGDIREWMSRASVNICPMRTGTGIKYKILEAMALARPVVATQIACDGINETKDGENILIAADGSSEPQSFANKIIQLLKDRALAGRISAAGRDMVLKNYTWQLSAEKFERLYVSAIEKSGGTNT